MKDYEKEIAAMEHCAKEVGCDGCPYKDHENGCASLRKISLEIIRELQAELDKPMPDYSHIAKEYDKDVRKLNDELCRLNADYERVCADLYEAQKELAYLRAVKATAEAFLGAKI